MVLATREDHARALRQYLPPGRILPNHMDSRLGKLLLGLSGELARLTDATCQVIEEADPRTALQTLDDWERVLGLPSECGTPPVTVEGRRAVILGRVLGGNGSTTQTLLAIAAAFGEAVIVTERRPYTLGLCQLSPQYQLGPAESRFIINVDFGIRPVEYFQLGVSQLGRDTLGSINTPEGAICAMQEVVPAHVKLTFSYEHNYGPGAGELFLRIHRTAGASWWIEQEGGEIVVHSEEGGGGLNIPVENGTLPFELEGGERYPIDLVQDGDGWILEVEREGGTPWQIKVDPTRLPLYGGSSTNHRIPVTEGSIPFIKEDGTELRADLEEKSNG